jgi:DNA-binding CsgD family transcriptional regulator
VTDAPQGFIGRVAEVERFQNALAAVARGTPRVFIVIGEAGIGKSTLVREWTALARGAGARVLLGNCVQLNETVVPFAPVAEMLRALVAELGADDVRDLLGNGYEAAAHFVPALGMPGDTSRDDGWGQGRLFEAILTLLARLTAEQPLVLVFEDLHWADQGTLDLVNYVVRNISNESLIIVGTERVEVARGAAVRSWTAEILRVPIVERVDLDRFGRAQVVQLLTELLGTPPEAALAEEIFRRSEGNAFFAEELLAAARGPSPQQLPSTLAETLLARVDALEPQTAGVLQYVAVGGGRVDHEVLAHVVTVDEPTLSNALSEAVNQHVIVISDDAYAFRHAAFTEAVYRALLPGSRARMHAAFAEALETTGSSDANAVERATHWYAAGDSARALPATIEAANTARRMHAPQSTTTLWERAVALFEDMEARGVTPDVDAVALRMAAADAANWSGDTARAIANIERALATVDATADPYLAGRLQERLGWFRARHGDDDGALIAYERALDLVPESPPSAARSVALAATGRARSRRYEFDEARALCEAAVDVAVAAGADVEEGLARHGLALALAASGDAASALTEMISATSIALASGDVIELAWGCVHLLAIGEQAGRIDDAVAAILDLAANARRLGLERVVAGLLECIAAGGLVELGRWDEAQRLLDAVARRGPSGLEVIALHIVRGTLALQQGDFTDAAEDLHAARAMTLGLRDGRMNGMVFDGLAELARREQRLDEARATVTAGLASIENTGDDDMAARLCLTGIRTEADMAQRTPGERDVTITNAQRLLDVAESAAFAHTAARRGTEANAAVLTARAELARLVGDLTPERWEAACAAWDATSYPYGAAASRLRLAEALFEAGRRDDAITELRRAYDVAAALGAAPLVADIDGLARRAHVVVGAAATGPGGEPASNEPDPGSLTARELDVLRLVAAGRTNRQIGAELFISEKTASVHVSRILAKLGVSTRGEAGAVAHLRGLAGEPVTPER